MRPMLFRREFVIGVMLLGVLAAAGGEITDMAGRQVTIPDRVTRVYAAQPYTSAALYVVAPDLVINLQPGCFPLGASEKRFLTPAAGGVAVELTQPVQGEHSRLSLEAILALRPDVALAKGGPGADTRRIAEQFARIRVPVVFVDLDGLDAYPAGLEFLGRLLGREERAAALAAYARQRLAAIEAMVAAIPPAERVRVYYAESEDGLATESDQSFHAEPIRRAGGVIVHQGELKTHFGMEKVSLEQVLLYDPEVIVSLVPEFAGRAYADVRWQGVKAVSGRRIYTVPRTPSILPSRAVLCCPG
ncbi:MAG: ABC transporter substrate-binding protein [Lentisphaerae bacterium]|nr:ABC transporter substrate-binding protein [Lentisphaerota bacterium]